jgi:methylated-DNA-[protein]-cysteine S-methyltransferase
MRIIYHVMSAPAPLGLMFMAATDRGLRYLEYLDRRSLKRAIAAHAAENPGATWEPSVRELRPLADLLERWFCGAVQFLDVPLDPVGSEFQLKVWRALGEIPYGETRTYGDIAKAIGEPKAARSVGLACNQNPIVIATPCHRVIGADGKLVGYNGGLPRKKTLLALEARFRDMLPLEGDRVIAPITVKVKRPAPAPKSAPKTRRAAKGGVAVATKPVAARKVVKAAKVAAPARKRAR